MANLFSFPDRANFNVSPNNTEHVLHWQWLTVQPAAVHQLWCDWINSTNTSKRPLFSWESATKFPVRYWINLCASVLLGLYQIISKCEYSGWHDHEWRIKLSVVVVSWNKLSESVIKHLEMWLVFRWIHYCLGLVITSSMGDWSPLYYDDDNSPLHEWV